MKSLNEIEGEYNYDEFSSPPGLNHDVSNEAFISSTSEETNKGKIFSILSLLLGIISIFTGCCTCFLGTGGIAAIAAIILGMIASKKYHLEANSKRSKTIGIVCGIIGIIMNMMMLMFIIYANLISNSNNTSDTTSKSYTNTSSAYGKTYSSYNQALDALAEGLTNSDGKAIYHIMLTDEIMDSITQEEFDSLSDLINTTNSTFSAVTGKKSEWSFKKSSALKLSDDDIGSIKYYYSSHHSKSINIIQGYQVKAKMKYCDESDYVYINVIEVPNEGWKVSEEFLDTILGGR